MSLVCMLEGRLHVALLDSKCYSSKSCLQSDLFIFVAHSLRAQ